MWGYGARKDIPAQGVRDRLWATGVVLRKGETAIAVVGLDLGRSPARRSLEAIRREVKERAGVETVFLTGSHTHHGPCVELEDAPPTSEYVAKLRRALADLIVEAAERAKPAVIRVGAAEVARNRNRHTKIEPKPVDRTMTVVRIEDAAGGVIATLVNYAAHPTTLPAALLQYSADYPGALRRRVEETLGGVCVFLQGACGDLSTDRRGLDTDAYGTLLGDEAVRIAEAAEPLGEVVPAIHVHEEEFRFGKRIDLNDRLTYLKYTAAFFKDLVDAYVEEYKDGIRPRLTVALVGGRLGLVGVSGEFFAAHALRLRERARIPYLCFLGYTNGYHQYFPTIEAVAEGGYGADKEVSPVEIGAGERMMDRALIVLYRMRGMIRD